LCALSILPAVCFAQAADTPFQVGVAVANKNQDTTITVTNSGASSTTLTNGTLCANFYALSSSNGSLLSCCSCAVAPNALKVISATNEFLPSASGSQSAVRAVVKMMATTGTAGSCSGSATSAGTGSNVLATGLMARETAVLNYGSYIDPGLAYAVTQNSFTSATLSAAELSRLTSQCAASPNLRNTCLACN
jgi:hypothetical protein